MHIDPKDFRIQRATHVRLENWPTMMEPVNNLEQDYKERLQTDVDNLSQLQRRLYASGGYAVLLIYHVMDTAGKDGAINHVLSGINPEGCDIYSFKQPSAEELTHDFLWRTTCCLPARGRIGVFNRSYYEEVLVVRVHPEILRNEHIHGSRVGSKSLWKGRYGPIVESEKPLRELDLGYPETMAAQQTELRAIRKRLVT